MLCLGALQILIIAVLLLYCHTQARPLWLNVPGYSIFCQCSRLACNQLMGIFSAKEYVLHQDFTISILYIYSYCVCICILILKKISTAQTTLACFSHVDWQIGYRTEWDLIHTCCFMYHPKDQSRWWNYPNS